MNYYHELLNSYSQLRKRSLRLTIMEAEKSTPEKKDPKADREEKEGATLEAAYQKALEAYNAIKSNPQQWLQGAEIPGATKPTLAQVVLHPQTGVIQTLKFDNSSPGGKPYWVSLISRGQEKPQKYDHKQNAWYGFVRRFTEKEEMSDDQDKEETQADQDTQQQEEAAAEAVRQQNEALLKDFQIDFGLAPPNDREKASLANSLDYFGEGEDNERNGFISNLNRVVDSWIEDTEVGLDAKVEGSKRLKDFVELSVSLKDKQEKVLSGEEISKLTSIMKNLSLTTQGELLLNNLTAEDAGSVLRFGLTVQGEKAKGFEAMLKTLTDAKDKYNSVIGEEDSPIPDPPEIEVEESGSSGKTVNDRSAADEALMAGAGMVESIVASTGEARSWGIQKLKALAEEAYGKLIPQQLAETLGRGLDAIEGVGVPTLLTGAEEALTTALINRLQVSFPQNFADAETATAFVEELATEPDGLKAFSTFLLLRGNAFRQVMGENSPLISIAGGKKWGRVFRRKMDVAYVFPETSTGSLESHLSSYLKKRGVGDEAEKFILPTTLQELKDQNVLDDEDIPPHLSDKLDTKVTIAAISLKTLANYGADANLGSNAANSVVSREGVKSVNGPERTKIFESMNKLAGITKKTIGSLKQFYRSVPTTGKAKDVQDALAKRMNSHARSLRKTGTPRQVQQFKQALALDLLTVGGIASEPQLNVTNYLIDGTSVVESDESFRNKLYKNIKRGSWEVTFGGKDATVDNFSDDNRQMFIKDKKGTPIVRINSSSSRFNIWKTSEYQQSLMPKTSEKKEPENSSTLIKQFLNAQADLIQELLANQ